jgi:hypothetical protein
MLPHTWLIRYEPTQLGGDSINWKVAVKDVRVATASATAAAGG